MWRIWCVVMAKFSDEWLNKLHCVLWVIGETDVWTIHRILYEASIKGYFESDEWVWFGKSPRSAEVDAALALFELTDTIRREENIVKVSKPPSVKCESYDIIAFVKEALRKTT